MFHSPIASTGDHVYFLIDRVMAHEAAHGFFFWFGYII